MDSERQSTDEDEDEGFNGSPDYSLIFYTFFDILLPQILLTMRKLLQTTQALDCTHPYQRPMWEKMPSNPC